MLSFEIKNFKEKKEFKPTGIELEDLNLPKIYFGLFPSSERKL